MIKRRGGGKGLWFVRVVERGLGCAGLCSLHCLLVTDPYVHEGPVVLGIVDGLFLSGRLSLFGERADLVVICCMSWDAAVIG